MELIQTLITIVVGLGTLSLIVMVHEYGHYWVARRCGVTVERFSIGFGKPFLSWRDRAGTEFSMAPILLGGYVKMYGETPEEGEATASSEGSFASKPVWQRSLIVVAGPAINFLFAILIYWGLMMGGRSMPVAIIADIVPGTPVEQSDLLPGHRIHSVDGAPVVTWPDVHLKLLERIADDGNIRVDYNTPGDARLRTTFIPVQNFLGEGSERPPADQLGIVPRPLVLPRIARILPDGSAQRSGLRVGDVLLSADGVRIFAWTDWVEHIRAHPGVEQVFVVDRAGSEVAVTVYIDSVEEGEQSYGRIGVAPDGNAVDEEVAHTVKYSLFPALWKALEQSWDFSVLTLKVLGKMVVGAISPEELSGPISIVKISGEAAAIDLRYYLGLIALISLNLGLINLLPIPVLDGGQLLYLGAEAVRRRPLPAGIQVAGQLVGITIIGTLMIFVIYNDIVRL